MSLLHRLNLLEKFLILGTLGLMMSALPTYLTVSDSLHAIGHARQEARGVPPVQALTRLVQHMQALRHHPGSEHWMDEPQVQVQVRGADPVVRQIDVGIAPGAVGDDQREQRGEQSEHRQTSLSSLPPYRGGGGRVQALAAASASIIAPVIPLSVPSRGAMIAWRAPPGR